ncbi:MAG TPA: hypothetical protein VGG28_32085 [Kofleriaceae bacterium]
MLAKLSIVAFAACAPAVSVRMAHEGEFDVAEPATHRPATITAPQPLPSVDSSLPSVGGSGVTPVDFEPSVGFSRSPPLDCELVGDSAPWLRDPVVAFARAHLLGEIGATPTTPIVIEVEARTKLGSLLLARPGLETAFYCLHVDGATVVIERRDHGISMR